MKKLIVFTNEQSIETFMPQNKEMDKVAFIGIDKLENKEVMALRGNVLISDYNEEDVLFLASDMIDQQSFKEFYNNIKGEGDDIYILYHLNDHGNKFDHGSILFDIDEKRKKVGQHVKGDGTYDVFTNKTLSFLTERGVEGREWQADEFFYTQDQVQEIISAIFKDEADDKLNEVISYLYAKFKQIYETEKSEKEKKDAFERLAREQDALLNTLINNQK